MPASQDHPIQALVLIVDQPSEEIEQVVRCLKEYEVQARVVSTAAEALVCFSKESVQLVLSELSLPDQDGLSFIKQLREKSSAKYLPIIITTQEADLENRINSMALDIDDYIIKPYYPEEIAARIDAVLQELVLARDWTTQSDHSFMGRLEEMNLIDLIQIMAVGEKTGVIRLSTEEAEGHVVVSGGQVWDAHLQNLASETALVRLLLWSSGVFQVQLLPVERLERILNYTTRELAQLAAQLSEARRQLASWLPALQNAVIATPEAHKRNDLTEIELGWVRHLCRPYTVESLLNQPDSAVQTLQTCQSLLEQGLLEVANDTNVGLLISGDSLSQEIAKARTKHNDRYSRIASFFRRSQKKKLTNSGTPVIVDPEPSTAVPAATKYPHHLHLDRAEILLLRQRFLL